MLAVQSRYYGCAAHKDRGPAVCRGTFAPRREKDARLVAAELQTHVLAPDAIAQIGLSPALRQRLTAAEDELTRLDAASRQSPSPGLHDVNAIRRGIKAMAADLQQALTADVSIAHDCCRRSSVTWSSKNGTTECKRRRTSAPYCFAQPGPNFLSFRTDR